MSRKHDKKHKKAAKHFNAEAQATPASAEASSAPAAKKPGRIVDYADAAPEVKAAMDQHMAPFDKNPASGAAIRAYGQEAFSLLGKAVGSLEVERQSIFSLQAAEEFNIVLGANKELVRRYDEKYMPDAAAAYAKSKSREDERRLRDVMESKNNLLDHMSTMEGARLASIVCWTKAGDNRPFLATPLIEGTGNIVRVPDAKP